MDKLICVDAGHGGTDPGATNGGLYEKAVTLATAKLLKKELEEAGFSVIMTRETDKAVSLPERCIVANSGKADLFVSIHCNSAENKQAHGVETWHYEKSAKGKAIADKVQKRLIEATGAKDRGTKGGTFFVLRKTVAPAILCEIGFISHPDESQKLFRTSYQTAVAKAICQGVIDTFQP